MQANGLPTTPQTNDTQSLGALQQITTTAFGIEARLQRGRIAIHCLQGGLFKVIATRAADGDSIPPDRSYAIMEQPARQEATIRETGNEVRIEAGFGALTLRNGGALSLYAPDGALLSAGSGLYDVDEWLWDRRSIPDGEDFYGLGEQMTPLGRRGYRIDNFNWDQSSYHSELIERMYTSIPFCIAMRPGQSRAWGLFVDSSYRTLFDVGNAHWDRLQVGVHRGDYVAYFFAAAPVAQIVQRYGELTGRHLPPPLWALGYHQCRYSYMSAAEAQEIAHTMRTERVPCDALWYDIDYMDSYRIFTIDRTHFDKNHFQAMHHKDMHFRTVVIVDPALKHDPPGRYPIADEAAAQGYFLKTDSGADYIGTVWPGKVRFPDFSRAEVRDWWGEKHRFYFEELGIDGIWNDMNEPADLETSTLPDSIRMYDDGHWSTHDRMHNVYALFMAQSTHAAARRFRPTERPFILTRSGSPGIQRYSAVWTGDNSSTWHHLAMSLHQIVNMGLSGIGFCGADIGGFFANTTPELLARWYQLGAFYPFMRNHSMKGSIRQEPWAFDERTTAICRAALELRYRLLPYLYQLFRQMHRTGAPIVRPMFWHYSSPQAMHAIDQFLFGCYLLVAPVLQRSQTSKLLWLPPGVWYDFATDMRYAGGSDGTTIVVDAPLDAIPLFVRAGSIVPTAAPVQYSGQLESDHLFLDVWPFAAQPANRPTGQPIGTPPQPVQPVRERLYTDFLPNAAASVGTNSAGGDAGDAGDADDSGTFDELELSPQNYFRYRRHSQSPLRAITIRLHRDTGAPIERRLTEPVVEIALGDMK